MRPVSPGSCWKGKKNSPRRSWHRCRASRGSSGRWSKRSTPRRRLSPRRGSGGARSTSCEPGSGVLSFSGMPEDKESNLLVEIARELAGYRDLRDRLARGESGGTIASAAGALPGALLAALRRDLDRPVAIVVADEEEAERLLADLSAAGLSSVFHAPAPTLTPYQRIPPSLKSRRDEFALLAALSRTEGVDAIVLPARSLFTRLPAAEKLGALSVFLEEGKEISLSGVVGHLTRVGYRRADLAIETGDLAVRGGLFDVFPPARDLPGRVELDGDRLASLRVFGADTHRSRERVAAVTTPRVAPSRS